MIAAFDELFGARFPAKTAESDSLVERICAAARAENRAAAEHLTAIGPAHHVGLGELAR